jgi:hypothetical protein
VPLTSGRRDSEPTMEQASEGNESNQVRSGRGSAMDMDMDMDEDKDDNGDGILLFWGRNNN